MFVQKNDIVGITLYKLDGERVRNIGMRKNGKRKGTMKMLFNKQYLIILQNN